MNSEDKHYQSALAAWRAGKETRAIVTPFAFKIDEQLLGKRLARPIRRAFAMLIDVIFVSLLSYLSEEVVLLVAAVTVWKLTKDHRIVLSAWARRWLRIISGLVILVTLLSLLGDLSDNLESDGKMATSAAKAGQIFLGTTDMVALAAKLNSCADSTCVDAQIKPMQQTLDKLLPNDPKKRNQVVRDIFTELPQLSAVEKQRYIAQLSVVNAEENNPAEIDNNASANNDAISTSDNASTLSLSDDDAVDAEPVKSPSVIDWVGGVMKDFGLGLSWAALYFTLFTAWWQGQTPGKRLLRIKVVRLNGEPISLWGAFGRYGGYGAGITTGLIGFMQVYWDNNRQCIQDKIGETVVIQLSSSDDEYSSSSTVVSTAK